MGVTWGYLGGTLGVLWWYLGGLGVPWGCLGVPWGTSLEGMEIHNFQSCKIVVTKHRKLKVTSEFEEIFIQKLSNIFARGL